ncbi:VOC family protein [Streptomyces sp. NPDC058525]|uniref:VOC family protein n=1 Tax=Streptomyces sp. NPDC058525 TaxID=3346538 RepID=UPI00364AF883
MDEEKAVAPTAGTTSSGDIVGAPCWISLMVRDLPAAQAFYGQVLGWRYRRARLGDGFITAVSASGPVAGIGVMAADLRMEPAWTAHFAVGNADAASARILERGATVAVGPLAFPVGRGALAADRDGAAFGIWEGELIAEWPAWRKRSPVWLRLHTRDALDAAIFYGQVLEWAGEEPGACQVAYEREEVVVRHDGHVVARISSGAIATAQDPMIRPKWHVYFAVADVAATARAAVRHGGRLLEPGRTAREHATLCDPEGALFTVVSPARP